MQPDSGTIQRAAARNRGALAFTLNPRVRRWLDAPDPEDAEETGSADDAFDRWLGRLMAKGQAFDVGGVLVDRLLLDSRFACVPERCSPAVDRGLYRSCCADLTVYLSADERRRLGRHRKELAHHLAEREPRLVDSLVPRRGRVPAFWLDDDGNAFDRPGKRCVFSRIDETGRIRCHLHAIAARLGLEQSEIQPLTCRIFPLVLVSLPRRKVLVTVLNRSNHRVFGSPHPKCFACLNDDSLPPLLQSMGPTLDWLFAPGFAEQAIQQGQLKYGM